VLREALGSEIMVHFIVDARPALTEDVRELAEDVGGDLPDAAHESTLVARFNARSRVREGEEADVAVDTSELHFFDPESGLGIYGRDTTKGEAA
jgi:multiple sugar transport system ATP-binding protein